MAIDIGRVAHKAYLNKSNTSCLCFDRAWEDLSHNEQDAWRHAAVAVAQYLDEEKVKYEIQKLEDNEAFPNDY
jgi:hypothetical protein